MGKQGQVYEVVVTVRVNYWLADDDVHDDNSGLESRVLRVIANDILDGWITEKEGLDSIGFVPLSEFDLYDMGDREFDMYREDQRL